jgi:hypothetical protein
LTETTGNRNVLLAVDHECDRRAHTARLICGELEQLVTGICFISHQTTVVQCLEHQIAGCRHRAAANAAAALDTPLFHLR